MEQHQEELSKILGIAGSRRMATWPEIYVAIGKLQGKSNPTFPTYVAPSSGGTGGWVNGSIGDAGEVNILN